MMTQQFKKMLTVLAVHLGSVPNIHRAAHNLF